MKKFYLKITRLSRAPKCSIHFSENPLTPGEKGNGSYFCIEATDNDQLQEKLEKYDFTGGSIVTDPVGE